MMSEWEGVRRYKPQDREDIFRIAADTAFFGEPVETLLEDRRVFCDAFVITLILSQSMPGWPV